MSCSVVRWKCSCPCRPSQPAGPCPGWLALQPSKRACQHHSRMWVPDEDAPVHDAPAHECTSEEAGDDAPAQERTAVMRCARCNHPIAAAADLLPEQIARLESASYPYQLDLLGNEEAWVYSATNAQQRRFDVCRFGVAACARLELSGTPTDEHSFFPPFAWRMASCARCSAHLGWTFGAAEGGEPQFAGLILTHLREAQCSLQELNAPPRPSSLRETEQLRHLLTASGHGTPAAQLFISQLIALLEPHSPAGRQQILAQLRGQRDLLAAAERERALAAAEVAAEAFAEAAGEAEAGNAELPAEADRETELQWAAGMIQEAASNALLQSRLAVRMRQLERAAGGGEEPDGAGEAGASEDDE